MTGEYLSDEKLRAVREMNAGGIGRVVRRPGSLNPQRVQVTQMHEHQEGETFVPTGKGCLTVIFDAILGHQNSGQ